MLNVNVIIINRGLYRILGRGGSNLEDFLKKVITFQKGWGGRNSPQNTLKKLVTGEKGGS
jgi:hypothetical protein